MRVLTFQLTASYVKKCFYSINAYSTVSKTYRKATHCIFDLDGLLLNSETLYKIAYFDVAKHFGKVYTDEVLLKHTGMPSKVGAKIIINELNLNTTVEQFLNKFHEISYKLIGQAELMPGANELVEHLKINNVPIAIATASEEPAFTIKTKKHQDFLRQFNHIVLSVNDPEVRRGKPFPDVYLVAARRFKENPNPENCLAFEDSANGVKAAVSANMQCIMVPDPIVPDIMRKEATLVVDSLRNVPLEKFGITPMDK